MSVAVRHPLFTYVQCGTSHSMTYPKFIQILRLKLAAVGLQPELYSGHSFRRGEASLHYSVIKAFALHLQGELIQLQGGWSSDAYLRYLEKPLTHVNEQYFRSVSCLIEIFY